jgi:peptidoglycan/LPS O-acetylase OafA/YrhL
MTTREYSLGYRSDIEGLRAVAILVVVAAHAKLSWLAGGFVGVDVFFVLSGYLITGLLMQEIKSTRSLRLAAFYARRLRRLLPALLLVLGCTGIFGALLVAPVEQIGQAVATLSAALWLSNFYFAFSNLGYFSPGADTNLVLHTWSLGVEEQFYLIWPIFLMLALGKGKTAQQPLNTRRLKIAMLIVFSISLLACLLWTQTRPLLAFYMMPARAWQFALGALVFLYFGAPASAADRTPSLVEQTGFTQRLALGYWCGWLGLTLIVMSAVILDTHVPYPGMWAVLPSIGAAAVLAAGARHPGAGVGSLLSLRPMQSIGRVSYSWYLWHWPVFLLGATLIDTSSAANQLGLALLSFMLAWLSYHYFESPIRRNPRLVMRPRRAVFSALALMVFASVLAVIWHNDARHRMTQPEQLRYLQVRSDGPVIYGMGCDDWYHSADVRFCAFGPKDATHTAIVMGDSVGLQWFPAYAEVFNKSGWRLLVLTKSACPMVDESIFYTRLGREYTECTQWRQAALQQVAALKPDVVILGSTFAYDFTQDQWINGTVRVLQSISKATKKVYIMRSTPVLPFDGPSCLAPRSRLYSAISDKSECVAIAHGVRSNNVYQWLQVAASQFNNVSTVDMTDAICPKGQCHAEQQGSIVFRDSQHLSATFAESLSDALGMRLALGDNL